MTQKGRLCGLFYLVDCIAWEAISLRIKRIIYLDYNTTTPVDPRVLEAYVTLFKGKLCQSKQLTPILVKLINAKEKQARKQIADFINAEPNELIFTSGATEAILIGY
jgi:cysteine desulfurase